MSTYKGRLQDASGNTLYPQADGYFKNDTLTATNVACMGFTTNSAQVLLFQIPLTKPIYASSFSVTSLKISARTANNDYMYDGTTQYGTNGVNVATSRVSNVLINASGIRLTVEADTRYNVSSGGSMYNNAPVALSVSVSGTFS